MNIEEKKDYVLSSIYLKEFVFFNGDEDVKFNIIDVNTEDMTITLAVTHLGKISVVEYDLKRNINNNLYFEYGCHNSKIELNEFENIAD